MTTIDPVTVQTIIAERIKFRRDDLTESIARNEVWIAEQRESLANVVSAVTEKVTKAFEGMAILESNGYRVFRTWQEQMEVHVTQDQLVDLRRLLGKFDQKALRSNIEDPKLGLIRMETKAAAFPTITISYTKRLKKRDRCRIKTERTPASTRKVLVCQR